MREPPVIKQPSSNVVCPECGAENRLPATLCWLCYRRLGDASDVITAEAVEKPPARKLDTTMQIVFGAMTLGVFGLVCLVSVSLVISERDLLLPVSVVILPAVIATSISLVRSTGSESGTNWKRAFVTMLASFGITIGILFLLAVALIVALFVICLKSIPHGP